MSFYLNVVAYSRPPINILYHVKDKESVRKRHYAPNSAA